MIYARDLPTPPSPPDSLTPSIQPPSAFTNLPISVNRQRGFQPSSLLNSKKASPAASSSAAPLKGFSDNQQSSSGAAWRERGREKQTNIQMCCSVKGNERDAVFFDHMARASSRRYISETSQMLKALSVCAQKKKEAPPARTRADTHTHTPIVVLFA